MFGRKKPDINVEIKKIDLNETVKAIIEDMNKRKAELDAAGEKIDYEMINSLSKSTAHALICGIIHRYCEKNEINEVEFSVEILSAVYEVRKVMNS